MNDYYKEKCETLRRLLDECEAKVAKLEQRVYDAESAIVLRFEDRAVMEYTRRYPIAMTAPELR